MRLAKKSFPRFFHFDIQVFQNNQDSFLIARHYAATDGSEEDSYIEYRTLTPLRNYHNTTENRHLLLLIIFVPSIVLAYYKKMSDSILRFLV